MCYWLVIKYTDMNILRDSIWREAKYPILPSVIFDQLQDLKPAIPQPFFAGALTRSLQTRHSSTMTEARPLGFDITLIYRIFRYIFSPRDDSRLLTGIELGHF